MAGAEPAGAAAAARLPVHIIESGGTLGGTGEVGVPPVAPALVNAIFAAAGVRRRELPVASGAIARGWFQGEPDAFIEAVPKPTLHQPEDRSDEAVFAV